MRTLCITACLFVAYFANSQNTTLIQNRNFRALELKHHLNNSRDSLILEGVRDIIKVTISNDSFSKVFRVVNKKTKIPLAGMPLGRFTTEVQLDNKLIIITLLRHKTLNAISESLVSPNTPITTSNNLTPPHRAATLSNLASESVVNENEGSNKNEDLDKNEALDKNKPRVIRFYWVVNFINKGQSSTKLMKLADLETVNRFIRKHEVDHRTKSGMHNELTIWEVYDTSEFMKFKRMNPDYATAKSSDSFNTRPFYKSLSKEVLE